VRETRDTKREWTWLKAFAVLFDFLVTAILFGSAALAAGVHDRQAALRVGLYVAAALVFAPMAGWRRER